MPAEDLAVFFYGLFMDEAALASKGIRPSGATVGYVDGFGLRIGARATLVRDAGNRTYGVLMTVPASDVRALYANESVADYVAEIGLNAADPSYGGAGIGTRMYDFAVDRMTEAGMKVATVATGGDPSHAPARRAYQKAGFSVEIPSVWMCRNL